MLPAARTAEPRRAGQRVGVSNFQIPFFAISLRTLPPVFVRRLTVRESAVDRYFFKLERERVVVAASKFEFVQKRDREKILREALERKKEKKKGKESGKLLAT